MIMLFMSNPSKSMLDISPAHLGFSTTGYDNYVSEQERDELRTQEFSFS